MKTPSSYVAALVLIILVLPVAAGADTSLEFLLKGNGRATPVPQVAAIKDGRIMVKGVGGDADLDLLYNRVEDNLKVIDHRRRSVMTVDEEAVERLSHDVRDVQPVLQGMAEQIAKLSPEERQRWQALVGDSISLDTIAQAAKPPAATRLVALGQGKVGGIPCRASRLVQGQTPMAELCLAEPQGLKIPAPDYDTVQALFALYERLAAKGQRLAAQFGLGLPRLGAAEVQGLPIQVRDLSRDDNGSLALTRIKTTPIPPERLRIPEDYQAKPLSLWQ